MKTWLIALELTIRVMALQTLQAPKGPNIDLSQKYIHSRPIPLAETRGRRFEFSLENTNLPPAMATTTLVEEVPESDKPKRTRKTHNKVRTGCLTCKYVCASTASLDCMKWELTL